MCYIFILLLTRPLENHKGESVVIKQGPSSETMKLGKQLKIVLQMAVSDERGLIAGRFGGLLLGRNNY